MRNFSFEHDGKTYWYSRSVACSMYVFVYDKTTKRWYVLMSKRGKGCPSNVGKWNVPGGYLDFDESLEEAAMRECFEETGYVFASPVRLACVSTNKHSKSQNVVCSFYTYRVVDNVAVEKRRLTTIFSERDEVDEIDFIEIGTFVAGNAGIFKKANITSSILKRELVAFDHDKMIKEIFTKRVNINPIKRWLIEKVEDWTKINTMSV